MLKPGGPMRYHKHYRESMYRFLAIHMMSWLQKLRQSYESPASGPDKVIQLCRRFKELFDQPYQSDFRAYSVD